MPADNAFFGAKQAFTPLGVARPVAIIRSAYGILQIVVCRTVVCSKRTVILSGARSAESKNLRISLHFAVNLVPGSFDSLRLNYCMIATGNHADFDSLRGAPRSG